MNLNKVVQWVNVKKIHPVWIKKNKLVTTIESLEGIIKITPDDYICRGINNEKWAIKKEDLKRRYKPTGKIEGDWHEYTPAPEKVHLWAKELTEETEVDTQFGKLKGKKGDFVIKEIIEGKEKESYWIVEKEIFFKTYELINKN